MLGVILWSSAPRREAIIWCDDHGPLAYLTGKIANALPQVWPQQGELVEISTVTDGDIRRVSHLSILDGEMRLAEQLRNSTAWAAEPLSAAS